MTIAAATALAAAVANAQAPAHDEGTIATVDATTMVVTRGEGGRLTLRLTGDTAVLVARAVAYEDLRAGDEVALLATTRSAGSAVPAAQGKVVSALLGRHGRQLIVDTPTGRRRIEVPEDAALVRSVPGSRADLVRGAFVRITDRAGSGGGVTALRIQVGQDGVRPPR